MRPVFIEPKIFCQVLRNVGVNSRTKKLENAAKMLSVKIQLLLLLIDYALSQNIIFNDRLKDQISENMFDYRFEKTNLLCLKELQRYISGVIKMEKWALHSKYLNVLSDK